MNSRVVMGIIGASLGLAGAASAETFFVNQDGSGDFTEIQPALDAADDGDLVIISEGVYMENDLSVQGKEVRVKGTIDDEGNPVTVIDGSGPESARIINVLSGETFDTVFENLVLDGGRATLGGGVAFSNGSSARFVNCVIRNCEALSGGGGLYSNDGSYPVLVGCRISGNTAESSGGGVYVTTGQLSMLNCVVTQNSAGDDGGGLLIDLVDPLVLGTLISNNQSGDDGAGMYISNAPKGLYRGCTFLGNSSLGPTSEGGGLHIFQSSPLIEDCSFAGNSVINAGGAIYANAGSNAQISGCSISGNISANFGGGISLDSSSPSIEVCLITGNLAQDGGGLFGFDGSNPSLVNTTICNNAEDQVDSPFDDGGGNIIQANCPLAGACCTGNGTICVSESSQLDCLVYGGTWIGEGVSCENAGCQAPCLGDADGDGVVDVNDILLVIARFNVACP
ncbi:MAG: right-handed parallel beta-helix repeat-containing protein [Phycisphaerales bacterium]|nr:right-handed parallel beta-helix repeat-containing protein [Phycisphaerales bacterium]